MTRDEFFARNEKRYGGINYDYLTIGEVVEVKLDGREPLTAQKSLLNTAHKRRWKVKTKIIDGKVYALREA